MNAMQSWIRQLGTAGLALGLTFCLAGQPVWAGGTGAGSGSSIGTSDDADTTPVVSNTRQLPGFVFEGRFEELRRVIVDVRGNGSIALRPTQDGRYELSLSGSLTTVVDRAALARSSVKVRYDGAAGSLRMSRQRGAFVLVQNGPQPRSERPRARTR